ncbi:glycosyltransferase involved in cell wall biosynthesis [Lutibacter oceani]|uniref:Glycosyltransferase involved in cell wall biosynthesis n=1 Tax=Lutibacter oceani TaxID=1853311 RepID=A0A3D9RXY7_9FLAO|nr:glycosyltransferase family 4 protein [Lutibacter oceani]REE81976.1 glycosyltransferase involved in cell wall biosynthesis [Lutibacter oceani]
MNKLLIISHTEHYSLKNNEIVGLGSTVRELNYLATLFEEVIHLAPLHKETAPKSAIRYQNNVTYVPLKPSGGKGFMKLNIFLYAPHNLAIVKKYCNEATIIQFRAPTGIGLYILPYLKYFNKKPYWVKYAGNWVAKELPLGNKLQRWWLQHKISPKTTITVNGNWQNQPKNIISFENPCLDSNDRVIGAEIIAKKVLEDKINFCFIGGLNANKGIEMLVNVFSKLNANNLGTLHIVGDGVLRNRLEVEAKKATNTIVFHGYSSKESIVEIYKKCHFIVLPSKSEGFPKVIGEAMNFGCVPIVSEVSCINQYVQNNYNGYLIKPLIEENLRNVIQQSLLLSNVDFIKYIDINYKMAEKFTFNYYLKRIQKEIVC